MDSFPAESAYIPKTEELIAPSEAARYIFFLYLAHSHGHLVLEEDFALAVRLGDAMRRLDKELDAKTVLEAKRKKAVNALNTMKTLFEDHTPLDQEGVNQTNLDTWQTKLAELLQKVKDKDGLKGSLTELCNTTLALSLARNPTDYIKARIAQGEAIVTTMFGFPTSLVDDGQTEQFKSFLVTMKVLMTSVNLADLFIDQQWDSQNNKRPRVNSLVYSAWLAQSILKIVLSNPREFFITLWSLRHGTPKSLAYTVVPGDDYEVRCVPAEPSEQYTDFKNKFYVTQENQNLQKHTSSDKA